MTSVNKVELFLDDFLAIKRAGFPVCFGSGFFIFRELWKQGDADADRIAQRAVELVGLRGGETILKVCKLFDRTYAELLAIRGARLHEVTGIGHVIFNKTRRGLNQALTEIKGFQFHESKDRCKVCDEIAQYNSEWKLWDGEKARIAKLPKTGDEIRKEKRAKQREHEINQNYFDFGDN